MQREDKIKTHAEDQSVRTLVYCCVTKKLLKSCESRSEASEYTGVNVANIRNLIKTKGKNRKNILGTILTFR